jgi:N-acetylglucosaminyldiphosphoundecaprenol N-acetyl-beta-D-mannosaminyltransferase
MSKQTTYDSVKILGVGVDAVTLAEATDYILAAAADRARPAGYVIKPYVEFLDRASGQPDLQALLNEADLSVADGVALLWAANYLYAGPRTTIRFFITLAQIVLKPAKLNWPIPERAAGTNFTWPLLEKAAEQNLRVYIIGQPNSADIQRTATTIQAKIPEINLVGALPGHDPQSKPGSVTDGWLTNMAHAVANSKADLILVGMGFPLQEKVCARLAAVTPHGLFIGEGGTFDYESFGGQRPKAPERLQKLGLEWLWRLIQEPSRFKRQLAIPRFIHKVWQSRK